jgi:hypothetical protein
MIAIDPKKGSNFIESLLEENLFPPFFDHIFKYYLGTSFGLEGNNINKAVTVLKEVSKSNEDKYLHGCVLNNLACCLWWSRINEHITEMNKTKSYSFETVNKLAKDLGEVISYFKIALINIENLENFENNETKNWSKQSLLHHLLTKTNSNIIDKEFKTAFLAYKETLTENKTSAIILSNIAEVYQRSVKEYKKSLLFLHAANLYFLQYNKNDPLYFKNSALMAVNGFKLNPTSIESSKEILKKIHEQMRANPNTYENVFIKRIHAEMLFEINPSDIEANKLIMESNTIEEKLKYFESRRSYLILPGDDV